MPNSPISASGLNRNNIRIQGFKDSRIQGVEGRVNLKKNFEFQTRPPACGAYASMRIANLKFFLRYSLFLVRYSAVLFSKSLILKYFSIFKMASNRALCFWTPLLSLFLQIKSRPRRGRLKRIIIELSCGNLFLTLYPW